MGLCVKRKKDSIPHHNWLIIFGLLQALAYAVFIMFTPSIYQFVTTQNNSSVEMEESGSNPSWPGLGGSPRDYAWVSVSFALFQTALFPLPTLLMDTLPYTPLILFTTFLYTISGVVYGWATRVWMVLVARGLMGSAALFGSSVIYTYTGEIGTYMDRSRQKMGKRPMKDVLYIANTLASNGWYFGLLGINAALVRIPSVNPYRLPGWFLVSLSLTVTVLVVLFFTEPRPWACRRAKHCNLKSVKSMSSLKYSSNSRSYVLCVLFVLLNAYITGQALSVVYTLVSPILSDQFGFTVDNTALFFVGMGVGGFASVLIQLCAKALRCNNRVMVGLVFVMIVIGCSLVTDWQAIHVQDPCRRPSLMNNVTSDAGEASNVSFIDGNTNESNVTQFQLLVEKCEARSTSGYECFWNPHSRVTGDQCNTCYEGCLSLQTYLDFYQYTVGVFLVSVGGTLEYIYNFALLSDIIPPENQGSITAFTIGCGALSRTVTPLWYVESYEQTGKHTFLPLIITMVTFLIALVVLAVLYKDLAPRNTRTEPQHATNPSAQELKPVTDFKM